VAQLYNFLYNKKWRLNKMHVIRAIYDGHEIKPIEPLTLKRKTEVLVILPDEAPQCTSVEARRCLRGSGRGQHLTEKLLRSRLGDIGLEHR
jgi:predicted DNA-binding antitoxin AbrB/MazE fold protein